MSRSPNHSQEKNSPSVSSCRKKSYNLWSDNSCDWSDWSEDFSFTFKSPVKRRNLSSDGDDKKFPQRKSIKQLPKDDDREPLIKPDDDIDPDSTVFDPPKKKCSNYYFLFDKNFIKNS